MHDRAVRDRVSGSFLRFDLESVSYQERQGAGIQDKKAGPSAHGYNQMKRCVERFVKDMESEHRDRKYWMHGSTFFNSGYVDYLDKNYMQSGIESIPPVEKPVDPEDEELVGDDWYWECMSSRKVTHMHLPGWLVSRRNRITESCSLRLVRIAVHAPRKTMFVHSP